MTDLSRRAFLHRIIAIPIAVVTAPLLAKIAVQTPRLTIEDVNAIALRQILPGLRDAFFANSPMMAMLRQPQQFQWSTERLDAVSLLRSGW